MKGRCPPGARGTEELSSGQGQNSTTAAFSLAPLALKRIRGVSRQAQGGAPGEGACPAAAPPTVLFARPRSPPGGRLVAASRCSGGLGTQAHSSQREQGRESAGVQGTWRGAGEIPKKIDKNRKRDLSARRERFQSLPRAGYAPIFRGRERPPPRTGTQSGSPAQGRGWRLHLQAC